MLTMQQLVEAVGEWSFANFGGQRTRHLDIVADADTPPAALLTCPLHVELGSLAPLMGIAEEVGELANATAHGDEVDAVGDILIYTCDYCARMGLQIPWADQSHIRFFSNGGRDDVPPLQGMVAAMGMLFHATLKHHQGIRGMDNPAAYREAVFTALDWFLLYLCRYVNENFPDTTPLEIANNTWACVVSKRNWRANKADGAAVDPATVDAPPPVDMRTQLAAILFDDMDHLSLRADPDPDPATLDGGPTREDLNPPLPETNS